MPKERTCQQPGCLASLSGDHVMCVRHWQALPKEARQQVQYRLNAFDNWDAAALWLEGYFTLQQNAQAVNQ
jgi:hypothetical protein